MIRIRIVAWLAAAVFLGGCACCCGNIGPFGPSPDLTVEEAAGVYDGPGGAKVTLNADGTFTAEQLQDCGPNHFGNVEGPESGGGAGTWTLHEPTTLDPAQRLDLDFGPPESYGWYNWLADEDRIFFFKGDPDSRDFCFFDKVQ